MKKIIFIGIAILIALVSFLLFTKQRVCQFPAVDQLTVSSVQYGSFVEYVPVTAEILQDTMPGSHDVRVKIHETYLRRIAMGLRATTVLRDTVHALELTYIYPHVIDGLITVDMNFVGAIPHTEEGKLLPLRLELSAPTDALLIPRGDFYWDTGGKWVFMVEENRAVRRDIQLGRKNIDYFEVIDGLRPGDRVITSSYQHFKDRQLVELNLLTGTRE